MKTTTRIPCRRHQRPSDPPPVRLYMTSEVVERVGGDCSMRKVDYWVRQGLLHPYVKARGSGSRRKFDEAEVAVAVILNTLSEALAWPSIRRLYGLVAEAARNGETGVAVGDLYISWRLS